MPPPLVPMKIKPLDATAMERAWGSVSPVLETLQVSPTSVDLKSPRESLAAQRTWILSSPSADQEFSGAEGPTPDVLDEVVRRRPYLEATRRVPSPVTYMLRQSALEAICCIDCHWNDEVSTA